MRASKFILPSLPSGMMMSVMSPVSNCRAGWTSMLNKLRPSSSISGPVLVVITPFRYCSIFCSISCLSGREKHWKAVGVMTQRYDVLGASQYVNIACFFFLRNACTAWMGTASGRAFLPGLSPSSSVRARMNSAMPKASGCRFWSIRKRM